MGKRSPPAASAELVQTRVPTKIEHAISPDFESPIAI